MTITQCIAQLQVALKAHGDIRCESDCPYCHRSFPVGVVAIAPETVRLNRDTISGPVGTRSIGEKA